jgi:HlyD family secretion protein
MDREISSRQIRLQRLKKILRVSLALALFILLIILFRSVLQGSLKKSQVLTATAEVGDIEGSITASGIVLPEFEQIITSPIQSRIEAVYYRSGETVQKDSSILKLNKEFTQNTLDQLRDELALKINRKEQLKLKIERSLIDLNADYDINQLRIQYLESKVEVQKHLNKIGVGIQEELDQAVLNLEISRRELEQLKKRIDNEKKSLAADLTELELEIQIQEKAIKNLERRLELADVNSLNTGVVTWVNDDIGANINPGDMIARVADLSSFKVEGKISDIHASRIMIGNPIRIRIGNHQLQGAISGIQPTIQNGIINFTVQLDDKTSQLLRSNLRVDVDVITSFKSNVVRVKNGPFINGSGDQDIFIVVGDNAIRRRVLIGDTNFDWVEIIRGVAAGEVVIISSTEKYIHRERVKIKS